MKVAPEEADTVTLADGAPSVTAAAFIADGIFTVTTPSTVRYEFADKVRLVVLPTLEKFLQFVVSPLIPPRKPIANTKPSLKV